MKAALGVLLAFVLLRSPVAAQEADAPSPAAVEVAPAPEPAQAPPAPALDRHAYWVRYDAEAERQAKLRSIDLKTPQILTFSFLVPAAALFYTAGFLAFAGPAIALDSNETRSQRINRSLAAVGGVFTLATIGAGIWWGQRRAERKRLERQLDSVSNVGPLRGARVIVQARADGVGVGLALQARL